MSCNLAKFLSSCAGVLALAALAACGGGGGSSSGGATAPISTPDRTPPVISFSPSTLTIESELSADVTLTATDNVAIANGPTVECVNNADGGLGTFSDNVFTAPFVIFNVTNICTATVSDAAGNQSEASLTVTIIPAPDYSRISDTITTDPVLGLIHIPTDPSARVGEANPETLVGVTKNASTGSVSNFAARGADLGEYDDAVVTPQSTLGTVGTAPLETFFADISGNQNDIPDLILLDEVNDELVAIPFNDDSSFGLPLMQSVPNACAAGSGALTSVRRLPQEDGTRTDILVGTPNGLFLVEAGDANGDGSSGLSIPQALETEGDFCNLFVDGFIEDTIYAVYDEVTALVSAYEEASDDFNDYELIFSSDISERVPAGAEHLLSDGFRDGFGLNALFNVFEKPDGGTLLIQNAVRGTEPVTNYDLDIDSPTDIVVFESSGELGVVLVSPTSEMAAYIPRASSIAGTIEYFEIGLGFDQVDYSDETFSLTFGSSTQDNVIVRRRR